MASAGLAFANGRFELVRGVGEGGYGAVYEAYDRELEMRVALKQLSRVGPDALLRFKREFRALADLRHDNVVRLYELFEEEGSWFFTMELLEGEGFSAYVRPDHASHGFDEQRLRSAIWALSLALHAVHREGLVHRDLKPDNVRVTPEGRLVLLDFGVAAQRSQAVAITERGTFGTADYMAPEQAHSGGAIEPAADWYALGVMLYEALTGHLPYYGSAMAVLLQKQREPPAPPESLLAGLPEDLCALCMRLLAVDPRERPTGNDVLLFLRSRRDSLPAVAASGKPAPNLVPFGRDTQLVRLRQVYELARQGSARLCVIEGDSGLGKSMLMHHFANGLLDADAALLVLRGACYQRETVPFKAFDGIVDGLALALGSLPEAECRAFVPAQGNLLVRAFPVLERVSWLRSSGGRMPAEPVAQRRLVFDGLLALLRGLAARSPLLICIEDLQWADSDSLSLLHALVMADDSPRCMFLATARPLEPFESRLGASLRVLLDAPRTERVLLSAMDPEAGRALTRAIAAGRLSDASIEVVVRESEGHPMFLAELVRAAVERGVASPEQGANLEQAILRRVSRLSPVSRTLLQLIAIASRPLPRAILRDALDLSGEDLMHSLSELGEAHLVRSFGEGAVECYHARVREAVFGALDPQSRAQNHSRLARTLEEKAPESPARIGSHWLGAGDPKRAIPWLERAAQSAEETYAFDQEAALYAELTLLAEHADRERFHGWRVARATALAKAGRSTEAAHAYLAALDGALPAQAAELRQLSAQALLQAGEVDHGLAEMRSLFHDTQLAFSETPGRALVRLGVHRAVLKFSNLWVEPLPDSQIRKSDRADLDRLFGLGPALGWVDMLRGVELQCRHTRLALKVRDARHLSLALAYEAVFLETSEGATALVDRCLARAAELARRVGDPYLHAVSQGSSGLTNFFRVQLDRAREQLTEAERTYREDCVGASWPLGVVRTNLLTTLLLMGECAAHDTRARAWLRDAEDRGDRLAYTSLIVLGGAYNVQLGIGEVEGAERALDACIASWPAQPFSTQHLGHIISKVNIKRTEGGATAHVYLEERWDEVARSLLGRSPFTRAALLPIRAQCALDAALQADGERRERLLKHAQRQIVELSGLRTPSARLRERLLVAQVLSMRGQDPEAVKELRTLLASPEASVLALEQAAATHLLGKLLQGDEGRALVAQAYAWAHARGFKDPRYPFRITAPLNARFE